MKHLILVVAALALAACATPDQAGGSRDPDPKEYKTGSHLPMRNPSASSTVTADTPAMQTTGQRPN